jgi:seryl-tRNA synthetase
MLHGLMENMGAVVKPSLPYSIEEILGDLLLPAGAPGVYARTERFERVIEGLQRRISAHRDAGAEALAFPPVTSRGLIETAGYHKSFPHLLGSVCCLRGEEGPIRRLVEQEHWVEGLEATDLVLSPAACYPLYPLISARGPVPAGGRTYDVSSYCFRREATHEAGRLQSFRMRELVCVGTPAAALGFRDRWMERARVLIEPLGLPFELAPASDPFFGRAGKIMAMSQVEQSLKFELLIPVLSPERPTACMSFNYHLDKFSEIWPMRMAGGEAAHTTCVAFGMERLALALFASHGPRPEGWPGAVRQALELA